MKFWKVNTCVAAHIKKTLSIAVVIMLVGLSAHPYPILAQEVTPTPTDTPIITPTDTPTPTETPVATPTPTPGSTDVTNDTTQTTNDISSTGDSGNNAIITPTPMPDFTVETIATDSPTIATDSATASSSAQNQTQENTDSHTDGSGNGGGGGGGSSGGGSSSTTSTGNATSVATVDNSVNTTAINATVVHQTINVFIPQSTPIDLSLAAMRATASVLTGPQAQSDNVNVGITVNNDIVYIDNTIASQAISGQNTTSGNGSGISTGDAASAVSMLNSVNTTIINSVIHVYTINIFTVAGGSIILPELTPPAADGSCCQGNLTVTNSDTTINNTVDSLANTGSNTISGSGTITTGNATSAVNVTNLINTTITDAVFYQLFINVFGTWNGQFRGWNTLSAESGGASISLLSITPNASGSGTCNCSGDITVNNSSVTVNNNVTSTADTGNNTASGRNMDITTGNAYSAVNIVNLINSSFINSTGFFAFINIFGTLEGDIGGASTFETTAAVTPTPTPSADKASASNDTNPQPHESGGELTITNTNNVGAYVLPGDTVTFFVKAKNIGTGMAYDTGIDLVLFNQDGVNVGGRHYTVGNIALNSGVKLTTGFVLSPKTPPGTYTARATITGTTGPNNDAISAYADSTFLVYGAIANANPPTTIIGGITTPQAPMILGATSPIPTENPNILMALMALLLLVPVYKSLKIIQNPARIRIIFAPQQPLAYRFRAIMTLLL